MKILKRNGIYYVAHGKKKISLFTDDESLAKQIFAGLVESITLQKLKITVPAIGNTVVVSSTADPRRKKKKQIPIDPAFADYLKLCELRKVCVSSMSFKKMLRKKLPTIGIKYFSDVDQDHINKLCSSVSKYAPDTQRKYFTELMAFLHASVKKGLISEKQVKRLEVPKLKSKVRDLIIPDEDLQKIMEYAKKRDRDLYFYLLTLYNTFSRPAEVTALKGSDFHLAERYVDVWQNKVQKKKQVFLNKDFCIEIATWIGMKGEGNLFNGAKFGREHYTHIFKKMKTDLGLNPQYTLYTFRHTSLTNLMNKTNDIEFVARQAGHNNPAITMKHYINRNSKHYIDLIDKMEDQNE